MLFRIFALLLCLPLWAQPFVIQELKTPKGQNYWAHPIEDLDFVSFELILKNCGPLFETPETYGATSLLCNVLSMGGGAYSEQEFGRLLKDIPCDFSIYPSNKHIVISIRVPTKHLDQVFEILKKLLSNADYPEEKLNLAREQALAGLKQLLHNPEIIAREKFDDFFVGTHPLNIPIESIIKSLPTLKTQDIKNRFKSITSNMFVSISGKFTPHSFGALVDKFSILFPDKKESVEIPKVQFSNLGQHGSFFYKVPQSILLFALPSIDIYHKDYTALAVGMELVGGEESLLYKDIREKQGLVYHISAGLSNNPLLPTISGGAACLPEKINDVIKSIRLHFKTAFELLSDKEIIERIQSMIHQFAFARSSTGGITGMLTNAQIVGRTPEWIINRENRLKALTPKHIKDALKTHLKSDDIVFYSLGKGNAKKEA